MSDQKKQSEMLMLASEITYHPCEMCSSLDYDYGDCIPDDDGNYKPKTCDQCNFGDIKGSSIQIH